MKNVIMKPVLYMLKRNKSDARNQDGLQAIRTRVFFLGILMVFSVLLLGVVAHASMCIIPPAEGSWMNNDSETRGITKLKFRMECRDVSQTTCSGSFCKQISMVEPHYFIHLFGSCHPIDCDWGEVEGENLTGGLDGWYRFYYDQGFARRYVYVRTYPHWPGWLRLWISTDFTDPGRADYVTDDWFRRP